jgi:hypothetical protein
MVQDRLESSIREKTVLRDHLAKQLQEQTTNLKQMERDAANLISGLRSRVGKLNVSHTPRTLFFLASVVFYPFFLYLHTRKQQPAKGLKRQEDLAHPFLLPL